MISSEPIATLPSLPQTFIVDTISQDLSTFSGIGLSLSNLPASFQELDLLLESTNAAWVQVKPKDGLKNFFGTSNSKEVVSDTSSPLNAATIKQLLIAHDAKLALTIDPKIDNSDEVSLLARQIKDWKIPFSHWQVGEMPYLELKNLPTPWWGSGQDFAKKMKVFTAAIKKADSSQNIYYAAGNTNRNLFTDEILQTESEFTSWSRLTLYNFFGLQKNKSEYIQKKHQNSKSFLIHIIPKSDLFIDSDFGLLFDNVLSYKAHPNDLMVDIDFTQVVEQHQNLLLALNTLNGLLKNSTSIQTHYTTLDANKEGGIQAITIFKDDYGNKKIAFANPYSKTLTVDLSAELDSSRLIHSSFTSNDTTLLIQPSKKMSIRPYSFNIVSEKKIQAHRSNPLSLLPIVVLDKTNLVIKWIKQGPFENYSIDYGQNKSRPENHFDTKSDTFLFDNLRPGRTYFFTLQGIDIHGNKSEPQTITFTAVPPITPKILSTWKDQNKVLVNWTPVPNAQNYIVRIFHSATIEEVETGPSNTLTIDSENEFSMYRFAVKGLNAFGESDFSPTSEPSQKGSLPSPPTGLRKEGNAFIWNQPNGTERSRIWYKIYKGQHPNLLSENNHALDTIYYDFTPIEDDTYFGVKSVNDYGTSLSYSNILTVPKPGDQGLSIFDVYSKGDSTNIIIKYLPQTSMQPPSVVTLILQDRSTDNWIEERIDCTPYLRMDLNQYRLTLPTKKVKDKLLFVGKQ